MQIVETLDYGHSLLADGNILTPKGKVITTEQYDELQKLRETNRLDWVQIPVDEVEDIINRAMFIAKTMDNMAEDSGQMSFAGLDSEGEPYYLRCLRSFGGAEVWEFAMSEYGKVVYQIKRNRPDIIQDIDSVLQEVFNTTDQTGTLFSPDTENSYLTKTSIRDGFMWRLVWKNGELSNVKKGIKVSQDKEVSTDGKELKNSISAKLANGGFGNVR